MCGYSIIASLQDVVYQPVRFDLRTLDVHAILVCITAHCTLCTLCYLFIYCNIISV